MDAAKAKQRLLEILREPGLTVVLSTVDAEGRPHSRFMGSLTVEGDGTLYMATHAEARKVCQLGANPHCHVLAATKGWAEIVTVSGTAAMEASPEKKRAVWDAHPVYADYFSGPDAPEYGLIRITAESGEYVCAEHAREPVAVKF